MNQPTQSSNPQPQTPLTQPQPMKPQQPAQQAAQQPAPQPNTNSSSGKSKPKMPLLLISLLVIIIASGSFYFLSARKSKPAPANPATVSKTPTPTPDPTTNWKTYQDAIYNFSISYPPTWLKPDVETTTASNPYYNILIASDPHNQQKNESFGDSISIIVYPNPNMLSSANYIKTEAFKKDLPEWNNNKQPTQLVNRQDIDATVIPQITGGSGPFGPVAYIAKGTNMIELIMPATNTSPKLFTQILQTFKFTDQLKIISENKISPDGNYTVTEDTFGDKQTISIKDKQGNTSTKDLIAQNYKEIGYNIKFHCMCGTYFKGWVNNTQFAIKIVNGGGEEYQYLVNAQTGKVEEATFTKIK